MDAPLPPLASIPEMLACNAATFGARQAIGGAAGWTLSHAELHAQVAAAVAALNAAGIGRGDRVALALPAGPQAAVAFLAVASAATAAPLNPAYGVAEMEFHLRDLPARALLLPGGSDGPARTAATALSVPIVEMRLTDDGGGKWEGAARALEAAPGWAKAGDVALVLHTSGTTSRPKRVPLTHANLGASAANIARTLALTPADVSLNAMPLFHIHGLVAGLLAALAAGGSCVCAGPFAAAEFSRWLERWQPTWFSAVPTMHQALLDVTRGQRVPAHSLRLIRSSSAALPPAVMAGLEDAFGVPVIEAYGMTEAAHQMASNPLPPLARKPGSVGLAAGPELAVLDEAGSVVITGAVGEVAIRGANITDGYENNPAANASAFTEGWFRTGDQGYLDPEGYLFITGRLKELINRGGEKIAPREVDEALLEHPSVRQAVAFAVAHPTLGEDVAAAAVLQDDRPATEAALRAFLLDRLPPFKVPSRIIFVAELPKGATGKVQRIGLAERLAPALRVTYEPPASPMEERVAATIREVLGCERVGRLDNFFALGGDSLRATQVMSRLQHGLALEVPVPWLFRLPTPALLGARLDALAAEREVELLAVTGKTPPAAIPPEPPRRVEVDASGGPRAIYTASTGQRRMWFLHHYVPDSPVYCTPTAFRLRGALDLKRLEAAFARVIARHGNLRATFAMEDGELVQSIAAGSAFVLEPPPVFSGSAAEQRAAAEKHIADAARRPFELGDAPPFRVVLAQAGPAEHLLLIVLHHIISDGWSLSNLCREVCAVYAALAAGRPDPLAELPVQFADFAAWQQRWLESGALAPQTAYWQAKLAGEPDPLDLPADRPRPATESFRGGACSVLLEPGLITALKAVAQEKQATLFMVLLAAFKVLLHRYTGQTDLLVGVPMANRQRLEMEGLIGYFANTLVLRTAVTGDLTFGELLDRVKQSALEAYEHQDMPFEVLVNLLQVRRDPGRTPLFQASFALQDYPEISLPLAGLEVTAHPATTGTSKFDMSLAVRPAPGGRLAAALEFSLDLFEPERARRLLAHWHTVLESIAARPTQRVADLALLPAAERQRVLVEWNATTRDLPADQCLHELMDGAVERTPDAVAVRYGTHALTYGQLARRSDQLAWHLRELGVGAEVRVGLCVDRSADLLVAMLAILKAGGAYVPLDPQFPASRLALILADAAAPVLITQRSLETLGREFPGRRVFLDAWVPGTQSTPSRPLEKVSPRQAAYVIYTSGSTGRPKGVVIEHRSVTNLLHAMRDEPGIGARDVLLAVSTMSFDISVLELFLPLSSGAQVVIVPDAVRADGVALRELLTASGATLLQATPTTWKLLLQAGWREGAQLKALVGGEALEPALARGILAQGAAVWNLYGPTETTIYSLGTRIQPGETITIGKPLANTTAYIVDAHGQPAPIGVPGELWLGGAGLAREYLNQPALTAERFVADPFASDPAARLYRTGDLCRWRTDGHVEFLGRADTQIKLRGYRIELGDIEHALREMAGIREAAVVLRTDRAGEKMLAAFVVGETGDVAALQTALRARLPAYMVPAHLECLPQLPLTPNGKVDRRALPEPSYAGLTSGAQADPPRSLLEHNLARLWQRVFHCEAVDRHANFFELGGHSLLAAQVVAAVEKLVGRRVPISALFHAPTLAAFAQFLVDKEWAPAWSSLVPLQPTGTRPPLFCVHGRGGDVYGFLDLARALPAGRPVYGLQAATGAGGRPLHSTMEEMAGHYATEIRSLQPAGPYHLIGHSMGGWCAYATAVELTRQGQAVASLSLLDTQASANLPVWSKRSYLVRRLRYHLKNFRHVRTRELVAYFGVRAKHLSLQFRRGKAVDFDYFGAMGPRYVPAKYPGNIALFLTGKVRRWHWSYWLRLAAGRVDVHLVPGDHTTLVEEKHAAGLALRLETVLAQSEQPAGRDGSVQAARDKQGMRRA